MESPFMEKAIPMVAVDEKSGKYVLTDHAIKFFKAITGPIAVVSVAGLYRTGKSYLLNRVLLNRSNGFAVGPTVNPCTKGLWCWGMPIKGTSNDGEPVTIVVIDTEGIGALDEDQTHDTKIFTLAILASSCFIYNSVGSIDETAIQNLSLVVNLTKHIQLKAQNPNDEGEDPDEISTYFPTFYWVVRDFSLQLQDPEGNPITPKEYLERALAPQNGFSDDIEQKNRIRRLLTAFFKDRDCVTMVRPLVDETKLQNLDKMDYDQLRLEFASQAMTFRKRIVSSIKPKTLQNQKLNGNLYCSMMSSYVKAINEGAVPNIENAWSYMCEEQCRRAQEECYETFITSIKEHWKEEDTGYSEEIFNKFTSEAEEKAIELYREKALGSHMGDGLKELRAQMKEKIAEICEKNKKWCEDKMKAYLKEVNKTITKKVSQKQYSSFTEYEKQVTAIHEKVCKEGPKLHDYRFVYAEAFRKMFPQGANFLFKEFTKQHEREVEMFKEKQKQTTGQLQYLKKEFESLKKKYNQMVTDNDQKILELTNKSECLQEQLNITLQSKQQQESKMERYYGTKQMENNSAKRALQEKLNEALSRLDDVTKQYQLEQQNWLKDKTVFEQQVKYQLSQIEELQKKEKSLDAAISLNKSNMTKEVRQLTMRLETEKENLKMQLEGKVEKLNEVTDELNNLKSEFAEKTEYFEKKEKKFKEDMLNAKRESEKTRKDLEMEKKQLRDELQNQQATLREEIQLTEIRLKESEKTLKELTDKFRVTKGDLEKQRSLLEQEMGFMKQENDSLRSKVTQLKESHQMALASYQASINQENQENMSKHIIEMKNEHANEIQRLNHTFESQKNRMSCEFNNITSKLFDTQTRFASYRTEKQLKEKDLSDEIEDLKIQLTLLTAEKIRIENQNTQYIAAKEEEFQASMQALKTEFEDFKASNIANLEKLNRESQAELYRLRSQVDDERNGYKKKLKEEKDKIEKNNRQELEQKEARWEEEKTELETRIQEMTQQIGYLNEQLTNQTQELQKQNEKLNRQITQLTKNLTDSIESSEKMKEEHEMFMDKMKMQYQEQKNKVEKKIEQLAQECKDREKEGITFRHQYETALEKYNRLEKQFADVEKTSKENQERAKNDFERMMARHKEEINTAREAFTMLTKDHALTQQTLQFTTARVQELEAQLAITIKNSQEKFEFLKSEKEAELKTATSKLITEKAQLDAKYQQLKVSYKESEKSYLSSLSESSKQLAVFMEKTSHLEGRLMDSQASKAEEVGNLRAEVSRLKEVLGGKEKESKEVFLTLNARIDRLESEKSELLSTLDKEKSLAQQREIMHTRAREENKRQSEERIKTLEMQLAREQNNRMIDKNAYDSNHSRMLGDIDSRNRQRFQELTDAYTKLKHQSQMREKDKDNTIKKLSELYETEKTAHAAIKEKLDKKSKEFSELVKYQSEQNDRSKIALANKESQQVKKLTKEKDQLKARNAQLQNNYKNKQQEVFKSQFQIEKERSRWSMEREGYEQRISNMDDAIKKLTKEKDKLTQEKEKLKNARTVNTKGTSYIAGMKTTYEPMKTEKSVIIVDNNKENTSFQ